MRPMVWCTYTSIEHPTCRRDLAALTCEYRMTLTVLQVAKHFDHNTAKQNKNPASGCKDRRGVCRSVA